MKSFSKKLLSVVMTFTIVFAVFTPTALANTNVSVIDSSNKITIKQSRYNASTSIKTYTVKNYNDFYNAVKESVNNVDETIKLVFEDGYLKNNLVAFRDNLSKIVNVVGAGSYIESYTAYLEVVNNKEQYTLEYDYFRDINEVKRQISEVDKIVKSVIGKIITPGMSDYDKEKVIHDYVVNTTRYDIEGVDSNNIPIESHTAYGVFVNKLAVCDGYASAMKKLLDAVGIETMIVVGTGGNIPHAWNLVKIDNKWYHVDATWDDPINIVNGVEKPVITYDYFNKTDSFMAKTHYWEKDNYPKANNDFISSKHGKRYMSDYYKINF